MLSASVRAVLLLGVVTSLVSGHGRLMDPPCRASMWRVGFKTPPNWTDDELNCGGVGTQHNVNKGKCGICGDAWNNPEPRLHETGGKYGKGIITRTYKAGQEIDVQVDITTRHGGWFEFRVCEVNDLKKEASQECLDKHILQLADGSGTRYPERKGGKNIIRVKLPTDLKCSRCVFQWHWRVGNSWGKCQNGKEGMGCGPQETFRGCSDIQIE